MLLRAFRRVLDERPDARLDIAGRGVLEHGLKDLARELGLNGAVRFLGHVTPVQRAVEQSLAVVVPSLGEGFGMVALEAMERARPVIAASIGGLEDLVRDGETGLLVRPGDAESLAEAMLALAADPARAAAMGREARRRAIERFPEARCTERTEEVYRYWLDRPPQRRASTTEAGRSRPPRAARARSPTARGSASSRRTPRRRPSRRR